mmetsp:Transcript_124200/g.322606  ORF Transcript_124200/g.322606 Transcript_124200/m.322606 type:complete len:84 (+) Transcript_124200:368-619(+)
MMWIADGQMTISTLLASWGFAFHASRRSVAVFNVGMLHFQLPPTMGLRAMADKAYAPRTNSSGRAPAVSGRAGGDREAEAEMA